MRKAFIVIVLLFAVFIVVVTILAATGSHASFWGVETNIPKPKDSGINQRIDIKEVKDGGEVNMNKNSYYIADSLKAK